jgi:NAD(P)H-hydrate repair Nnr-like enzyme with NAD(P)H-hydrate dehydratase domain
LQAGAEVLDAWSTFPGPVVVDADALRLLPTELPPPAGLRVLTPHSAEAAHLLGWSRDAVEADRFTAQQALSRWGLSVLKGPHTLVGVDPIRVNPTGDARLATAGTGDVLAGWIGAQLLPAALAAAGGPAEAVAVAVYRHGAAAAGMHSNRAGTLLDPR